MRKNEPTIRIRIKTRSNQSHDVTAIIKLTSLADDQFWRLIKACKPDDSLSFVTALQEILQQEKQGVLGQTIGKERENNPQNFGEVQERNQQGSHWEPDTGESGETYDKERALAEQALELSDKEKTGKLPALGLRREFNRETGYWTPTEAGS